MTDEMTHVPAGDVFREEPTAAVAWERRQPLPIVVRVSKGTGFPGELRLAEGSFELGAGRDADLVIVDRAVSRRHVRLTLAPEGILVDDLGSHNGTFYLGQRIERATLSPGSRIQLGATTISLDVAGGAVTSTPLPNVSAYGGLLGTSTAMRRLFSLLMRLEGSLVNVLIEGESGTGKELVARAIHERSSVRHGPFIAINCGAMDRALARSELFGHRRGAFSGAVENRVGAFEQANGGTLFLDEIGELPTDVQPVLLRALETGQINRVGDSEERRAKVRVVTATHRQLAMEVASARFREDLWYRLCVVALRVPPLRERRDDIELLVRHICDDVAMAQPHAEIVAELARRPWPGNVRQLRNEVLAFGALGELPNSDRQEESRTYDAMLNRFINVGVPYAAQKDALLRRFTELYVDQVLKHTGGNQSEAARVSGMDRSHLNKLAKGRRST
jgi:DNA-binding NtrC family response regulator